MQHIKMMAERAGRELPDEYKPHKPKYPKHLTVFYELSQRRKDDFKLITDYQIMEYVNYYGSINLMPNDMIKLIRRVDQHYLLAKSEKVRRDIELSKSRAKTPH